MNLILTHLPLDLSFVNENDEVAYYSATPERIFPRSPGVIGRTVQNCHPPKSVATVERILSEFKAGRRDHAQFWIRMRGRFLLIRYFAVRDAEGKYRGCLEVSQDVTEIRDMVYKEEHILFPAGLEMLTEEDWGRVAAGEGGIGYAWIVPEQHWRP